jgi:DNA polymerase-3 subunit chi
MVGYDAAPDLPEADVLIILTDERPTFYARFKRVIEIVDGDDQSKLNAREHYRFYRDCGYPLQTHTIDSKALTTSE